MEPFLKQAARQYLEGGKTATTCFIFPNRRSLVFFRRHLCSLAAESGRGPMLLPNLLTINDFFYRLGDSDISDRVSLLLELYDCYKALNPKAESLDDFIFWGDVLLSDFSDVDKYLVEAGKLFTNVKDLREIQYDYSGMEEGQKKAVEAFMAHFREGTFRGWVKERFLGIWNLLNPLYERFTAALRAKHMAYDGMVYRQMASRLAAEPAKDVLEGVFPGVEKYVFIGLNALSISEKTVLRKLKEAGLAEFCWDYSSEMIRNSLNRSSFFMDENISLLGQSFKGDADGLPQTVFNVVSVPSSVGQAKHLPGILCPGGKAPQQTERTAIVIPDEGLLQSVLNSIPGQIQDINVTMGFPMASSAFAALMAQIGALQLHMRRRGEGWLFYHRQVHAIFSSNVFRQALTAEDQARVEAIKASAQYYVPQESFLGSAILEAVFRPVVKDVKSTAAAQIKEFGAYQKEVIRAIAPHLKENLPQEVEFARRYEQCVTRLMASGLEVLPQTYVRLLGQLIAGESVPYNGEPVKGLQVMGPLETRALDFDTVVILSCNEGIFPRRSVSSSFIPPELRKGFGMPTYEYQDAVWAYYFYRLIQRASTVWLLYDSRAEKLRSGEESRYIKQLRYHFGVKLNRFVSVAGALSAAVDDSFPKPGDFLEKLHARPLSASSLENWLYCPAKFYYSFIEGLEPEDEVAESMDAGMLGRVFHGLMQALYTGGNAMDPSVDAKQVAPQQYVTAQYLDSWLKRPAQIKAKLRSLICQEMKSPEVTGKNLVLEQVIYGYALKAVERDIELLKASGTDRFTIHGLELRLTARFEGFEFKGFIDRLDSIVPGRKRIVDYKTGKVQDCEVLIDASNADKVLENLFKEDVKSRPKIALQMFLYDMLVSRGGDTSCLDNAVYGVSRLYKDPPLQAPVSKDFCDKMKDRLKGLLEEISDMSRPIRRTAVKDVCDYCDFKTICGK
ncbi:MAG: PD-(D/E)XK nuclease family protein [Bacteroidales bacterium]|nr:PD-(D/E)XK nuclease family protein [Bacteroidales bacterium]